MGRHGTRPYQVDAGERLRADWGHTIPGRVQTRGVGRALSRGRAGAQHPEVRELPETLADRLRATDDDVLARVGRTCSASARSRHRRKNMPTGSCIMCPAAHRRNPPPSCAKNRPRPTDGSRHANTSRRLDFRLLPCLQSSDFRFLLSVHPSPITDYRSPLSVFCPLSSGFSFQLPAAAVTDSARRRGPVLLAIWPFPEKSAQVSSSSGLKAEQVFAQPGSLGALLWG